MVAHDLLRPDAEGRHHIGQRIVASGLAGAARPILEELRRETGETAAVWVRRGDHRLCLASAETDAELRASLSTGSLRPSACQRHCPASGRKVPVSSSATSSGKPHGFLGISVAAAFPNGSERTN